MNNLRSPERIGEGDSIYLPVRARELGALLAHARRRSTTPCRKGDTLYSIAKKHDLTVAELRELNDLDAATSCTPARNSASRPARTMTAGGM